MFFFFLKNTNYFILSIEHSKNFYSKLISFLIFCKKKKNLKEMDTDKKTILRNNLEEVEEIFKTLKHQGNKDYIQGRITNLQNEIKLLVLLINFLV